MRNTSMKVRVNTEDLLKAVRDQRKKIIAAHERDAASYEKRLDTYKASAGSALKKTLAALDTGKLPSTDYKGLHVPLQASPPEKPLLNTVQIDHLISTLEIAADDIISISTDDAASYFG